MAGARPRGYMIWNPRPATLAVVTAAANVLEEYSSYGPMTVRQIFYRLVGQYGYDKTELAYNRLAEYLVKARRSGLIRFSQIRDDGTSTEGGGGWQSRESFWRSVRMSADGFELDHQTDQPQEIEVWCEAAGMAPMLARMLDRWHIPVYSTGGFSSVTVTNELAGRIGRREKRTTLLHVGDFDPSGESIFTSMTEDVAAFLAGNSKFGLFEPVRVALTEAQVEEYDLPTAPAKPSDSRSRNWYGETTQAEALPPDLLRDIMVAAVEEYIDDDALAEVLDLEARDKTEIDRVLQIAEEGE